MVAIRTNWSTVQQRAKLETKHHEGERRNKLPKAPNVRFLVQRGKVTGQEPRWTLVGAARIPEFRAPNSPLRQASPTAPMEIKLQATQLFIFQNCLPHSGLSHWKSITLTCTLFLETAFSARKQKSPGHSLFNEEVKTLKKMV